MGTQVPAVDDVTEQATDNIGAGIAGGLGVLIGTSVFGNGVGPIIGGTIAGATQTDQKTADLITISGMMQGFGNMGSTMRQGSGSNNSGGNGGVM